MNAKNMNGPINVCIGFDAAEEVAFHVLARSIHERASKPVSITPIRLSQLKDVYTRARAPMESTEFSMSRFLTPYLANYQGWSIFMDCDMLVLDDINNLWECRDDKFAVQVVKHVHKPKEDVKFLGQQQTKYEKKNWSSVMLFNNAKCTALTPEYVNNATGLDLHQFKWLGDDNLIGEIPARWNHLVGYYDKTPNVSLVHYTIGGPYFHEYENCEYADEWRGEFKNMQRCMQNKK